MTGAALLAEVPDALAHHLDERAEALVLQLCNSEQEVKATESRFSTHILRGPIHIEGGEFLSLPNSTVINSEGHEVARYFRSGFGNKGLTGAAFDEHVTLCRELHKVDAINAALSLTLLSEATFVWLQSQSDAALIRDAPEFGEKPPVILPFTQSVLEHCAAQVEGMDVWIPLDFMSIPAPFRIGCVTFKSTTESEFFRWTIQWRSRWPNTEHPYRNRVTQFFERTHSWIEESGMPVGIYSVKAEPIRAAERAMDEVQRVLGALRFYSKTNFYAAGRSLFGMNDSFHDEVVRHLFVKGNALLGEGGTSNEWPERPPQVFDAPFLQEMKAAGLDKIDALLRLEKQQQTSYQRHILKALAIYDRSTLTRDARDKLLNVVVALESLLVRDSEGSLRKNVAHRMAYLMGVSLDHRLDIIETYFKAYEARSHLVHRGEAPADAELLERFFNYAWHAIKLLIVNERNCQTKDELLEALDDMKFI